MPGQLVYSEGGKLWGEGLGDRLVTAIITTAEGSKT